MPQSHIQTSMMQTKDSEGNSLFSSFSREHSHYELPTAFVYKACYSPQAKISISFSYGFKRSSVENTTGMGLLAFHRIHGLTEADLFIPSSTEVRSLNCFGSACEDWSCLPEEAFHWDVAVR